MLSGQNQKMPMADKTKMSQILVSQTVAALPTNYILRFGDAQYDFPIKKKFRGPGGETSSRKNRRRERRSASAPSCRREE